MGDLCSVNPRPLASMPAPVSSTPAPVSTNPLPQQSNVTSVNRQNACTPPSSNTAPVCLSPTQVSNDLNQSINQGSSQLSSPATMQRYQNLEQALPQLGGTPANNSPAPLSNPATPPTSQPVSTTQPNNQDDSVGSNRTGFREGAHRRIEGSIGVQGGQWTNQDGQRVSGMNITGSATLRVGNGTDGTGRGGGLEGGVGTGGASATQTTSLDGNQQPLQMYSASVGTPGASIGTYGSTGPNPNSSSDLRGRVAFGVGEGLGVRVGQTDLDQDGVPENCIGVDVGPFSGDLCAEGSPAQGALNQIDRVANREEAERRLARGQQPAAPGHDGDTVRERRVNASMREIQGERASEQRRAEQHRNTPEYQRDPMNVNPLNPPPLRANQVRPGNVTPGGQATPQFVPLMDMNPDGTVMTPGQRAARDLQNGILPI